MADDEPLRVQPAWRHRPPTRFSPSFRLSHLHVLFFFRFQFIFIFFNFFFVSRNSHIFMCIHTLINSTRLISDARRVAPLILALSPLFPMFLRILVSPCDAN